MSEEDRVVNGARLSPLWGWRTGEYLISTDSAQAAESGVGYFTVARVSHEDYPRMTLHYVEQAMSLADAVVMAECDAQKRGRTLDV